MVFMNRICILCKTCFMRKEQMDNNPLLRLSIEFSLLVMEYCEILHENRRFVIENQLMRAATAIGANAMEAQNGESKPDFIHKIKIAAKEADETQYWLTLCQYGKGFPDCTYLLPKLDELQRILNSILGTAKRKNPFSYLFVTLFL